ncbi:MULTISPECIES: SpoIID/LytB domain-containing protein [unclassified Coleofasciculus]|uniref:SpoIID/LytB domain-containing protein n=1 Tax=unclassified Coleofasciculus TaxID=2692782 RepID=UPI001882DF21|nr:MULTISPECIES: SpoIID/LytB domain-containing protein [unclassified Coleofasciculus]MBE9128579.1 SpoIID/LytB domain-containing protein [Coleofasciculus sp. LEGE 07081]MBE9147926.1 SpoIID/LytB domain-containing protein [Coleofasciculus sp. LEGE 07092]
MASRRVPVSLVSLLKQMMLFGGRHWLLSFLVWIVLVGPAQAAMELRVAIQEGVSRVKVGSSTKAIVRDSAGQAVGELKAMNGFNAQSRSGSVTLGSLRSGALSIEPTDNGFVWIGDRWYRGRTRLVATGGGLIAVNQVDLDQYLYSVIGSEMSSSWPLEALKAQAVAARTYALNQRAKSGNGIYDVGDTTKWQVYKGLEAEATSTQQAVNDTSGQIMTYSGEPILAVFHSSSGGHTENVEDVWSQPLPYLRGVPDYDIGAPVYQWMQSFSSGELSRRIGGVGTVTSMTPESTTPNGRIATMRVQGTGGSKRVKGNDLRSALGLKSTLFTVSKTGGSFQINGRGYGHGLGLSQWGAHNLAAQGTNYQQILGHYYQQATLSQMQSR